MAARVLGGPTYYSPVPIQKSDPPLLGTLIPPRGSTFSPLGILVCISGWCPLGLHFLNRLSQITLLICAKRGLSSRWRVEFLLGPMPLTTS